MTPLNIGTFLMFIQFSHQYIFQNKEALPLSPQQFMESPLRALSVFWVALLKGIVAWALIFVPLVTPPLYFLLVPVMRAVMKKFKGTRI